MTSNTRRDTHAVTVLSAVALAYLEKTRGRPRAEELLKQILLTQAEILAELGDYYGRSGVLFNIALVADERDEAGGGVGRIARRR